MLIAFLNSLLLVAVSEMGDKTQLLAFALAAKFRKPWEVFAGILTATILNHTLAAALGGFISNLIPQKTLAILLGLTFIAFGFWTLKPDKLDGAPTSSRFGAFLTTTFLFFIAEMGDKTQLATVALAAKYQSIILVTLGTTLGMLLADGPAVFMSEKLSSLISLSWIRRIAAILFFISGIFSLIHAFSL